MVRFLKEILFVVALVVAAGAATVTLSGCGSDNQVTINGAGS